MPFFSPKSTGSNSAISGVLSQNTFAWYFDIIQIGEAHVKVAGRTHLRSNFLQSKTSQSKTSKKRHQGTCVPFQESAEVMKFSWVHFQCELSIFLQNQLWCHNGCIWAWQLRLTLGVWGLGLGFMGEGGGKGALGQPPPFPPFGAMPERKHEFKKELFLFTMIISRKCIDVFKKEKTF